MTHFRVTVVKLVVFAVVSVVFTSVVVTTLLDLNTSTTRGYRAVFTNANGLQAGDIVAVAGVEVGKVNAVALVHDRAVVSFSVNDAQRLTTTTDAIVGFENLLGNRYLMLSQAARPGRLLPGGATIPAARTSAGLDLTELFNGFQPLFAALTPRQVNQLTASIIQVFQGQSSTLAGLLDQTAALTTNLADRGQLIDQVIGNLTPLLHSVSGQDRKLSSLIDGLTGFVSGLAGQRGQLNAAIVGVGDLTTHLSQILGQAQPAINGDIRGLSAASAVLARNQATLRATLRNLTPFLATLAKVTDSGNYLSVYICDLTIHTSGAVRVSLVPGVTGTLQLPTGPVGNPADHTGTCR